MRKFYEARDVTGGDREGENYLANMFQRILNNQINAIYGI